MITPVCLKVNYASYPFAADADLLRFSWQCAGKSGKNARQCCYQLAVSRAEDFGVICYDNYTHSSQPRHVYRNSIFSDGDRLFWRVRLMDESGEWSCWSATASFTVAKVDSEEFQNNWIGSDDPEMTNLNLEDFEWPERVQAIPPFQTHDETLLMRGRLELKSSPLRVRAYVCGLGFYEMHVNGQRVGDAYLAPSRTEYRQKVLVDVYDVTKHFTEGGNTVGIKLAGGWYAPPKKWWSWRQQWYGSRRLWLRLNVDYADGNHEIFRSGPDWQFAYGLETSNCLFDGTIYDSRRSRPGWDENSGDGQSDWQKASLLSCPGKRVAIAEHEPERITDSGEPHSIRKSAHGWILDCGQNISGWLAFQNLVGKPGQTVELHFAEALKPDGELETITNSQAKATDIYTFHSDQPESWEPSCAWHGFQYVEVIGDIQEPSAGNFLYRKVHSDCRLTGSFHCSDRLVNHIAACTVNGLQINQHGLPTDCTQREERQGWLIDAALVTRSALLCFDVNRFYEKFLRDISDSQREDGAVPFIAPRAVYEEDLCWSYAFYFIAWQLYLHNGDITPLQEHYQALRHFLDYQEQFVSGGIMKPPYWGDHLCIEPDWKIANGMPECMSTVFYYLSVQRMAQIAAALDRFLEAEELKSRLPQIREAFISKYWHEESATVGNGGQSAMVFALKCHLVPEERRQQALAVLLDDIENRNHGHLTVGMVAVHFLIDVLDSEGLYDELWQILHRGGFPGWAEMLQGKTSIQEGWAVTKETWLSRSHCPYGCITSWFYRRILGIDIDEDYPGFAKVRMAPYFPPSLQYAAGSVDTVRGLISSEWHRRDGWMNWRITLPVNMTATVILPRTERLTNHGLPISPEMLVRQDDKTMTLCLPAGANCDFLW